MKNTYTITVGMPDWAWKHIGAAGWAVAVLLIAISLPCPTSARDAGKPLVAESNCGQFVNVLAMDAENNPYAGTYEEWDLWVFENAVSAGAAELLPEVEDGLTAGSESLRMYVTPEGYLVPLRLYFSELFSPEGSLPLTNCPYFITAVGVMVPDMRAGFVETIAKIRATSMPAIPLWLVDELPLWALMLPSGEVVSLGALGSGAGLPPGLPGTDLDVEGEVFYSYTADGTILGQTAVGAEWWRLFFVGFDEKIQAFNSSTITFQEMNGFIIFQDPANISVFEVCDFRGNKVTDPTQVFDPKNRLDWIDGGNIPLVYEAQNNSEVP